MGNRFVSLLCKNNNPGRTEKKLGDGFGSVDVNKDEDCFCEHIGDDSKKNSKKCALTSSSAMQIFRTTPPIAQ